MKRMVATLLLVLMVAGTLTGCGKKDYSFTQAEWDTNDLSFIETTPDPNEAYRAIGYFASRYEYYYAAYVDSFHAPEYKAIMMGTSNIDPTLIFNYHILENEDTAKKCYEKLCTPPPVFNGELLPLAYGDEGTDMYLVYEDEASNYHRYIIREDNCVLEITHVRPEYPINIDMVTDYLDYMY